MSKCLVELLEYWIYETVRITLNSTLQIKLNIGVIEMTSSKQDSDFIDGVIPSNLLEEAIDWIGANMSPEEVFAGSKLEQWAEEAGYIQGE